MAAVLNADIREKILFCAADLLKEKAFSAISLSDIAKKSGISKGTLYYYYNNKDDILFDVADKYLSKLSDDLLQWTADESKDTSLPRLFNYAFVRGVFNESGNLRLYLIGEAVDGHEALRVRLVERYLYFKNTLAEKLKERNYDGDSEYIAMLVLTIMDGLLIQTRIGNDEIDSEKFIKATIGLINKQL